MSGFVSGGTDEQPTERSQEWLEAQRAIEAKALDKKIQSQQGGGKSLFETLEANKAAKQEAFEESIRLKNQFRALDDDEVEFLESINETTRAKEDAVRRETAEQLNAFREQREKAERAAQSSEAVDDQSIQEKWSVSKKRKREKAGQVLPGVKLRKASSGAEAMPNPTANSSHTAHEELNTNEAVEIAGEPARTAKSEDSAPLKTPSGAGRSNLNLGLGAYSSDED